MSESNAADRTRVLVVAPQSFFVERGTPIAVRLLVHTLADLGYQVELLTFPGGQQIDIPGVTIRYLPGILGSRTIPPGLSLSKLLFDGLLMFQLLYFSIMRRYDVYHCVEESVFLAVMMKPLHRGMVVYDMDSILSEMLADRATLMRRVLEWVEDRAILLSDAVVAVCESLRERASRVRQDESVFLLPDVPVQFEDSSASVDDLRGGVPRDSVLSLYVGNLESYQGIDLLLSAFSQIRSDIRGHLVVIGGTEEHIDRYRQRSIELGVEEQTSFLGPRPFSQLDQYLTQADVLMSPRISGSNTPMKIYSYLKAGRAVLATDLPTHRQVLNESIASLAAPSENDFSAAWSEILGSETLRAQLARSASEYAEAHLTLSNYRAQLSAIYRYLEAPGA